MALIICKECGKQYSSLANACPNCGCPTEYSLKNEEQAPAAAPVTESAPEAGELAPGTEPIVEESAPVAEEAPAPAAEPEAEESAPVAEGTPAPAPVAAPEHVGTETAEQKKKISPVLIAVIAVVIIGLIIAGIKIFKKPTCTQLATELELGKEYNVTDLIETDGKTEWTVNGSTVYLPTDPGENEITFVSSKGNGIPFTYNVIDDAAPVFFMKALYEIQVGEHFMLEDLAGQFMTQQEWLDKGVFSRIADADNMIRILFIDTFSTDVPGNNKIRIRVEDRSGNYADDTITLKVNKLKAALKLDGSIEIDQGGKKGTLTYKKMERDIEKIYSKANTSRYLYNKDGNLLDVITIDLSNTGTETITQADLQTIVWSKGQGMSTDHMFGVYRASDISAKFDIAPGKTETLFFVRPNSTKYPNYDYYIDAPDMMYMFEYE